MKILQLDYPSEVMNGDPRYVDARLLINGEPVEVTLMRDEAVPYTMDPTESRWVPRYGTWGEPEMWADASLIDLLDSLPDAPRYSLNTPGAEMVREIVSAVSDAVAQQVGV